MSVVFDAFESFVGVNVWTMLFAWCNLLILYFFLKKILFVPMKNMIDSRQKEIDDMYKNASDAESLANDMKASYERQLFAVRSLRKKKLFETHKARLQEFTKEPRNR